MNDDAKALIEAVAGAALRPMTKLVDDVIGVLGGDALEAVRVRQKARRAARNAETITSAANLLRARGVDQPAQPNEAAVEDLLEAAQDEPREELRKIWAQLLAAMFDPARATLFRREFIDVAKRLEPIDARVLPLLNEPGGIRRPASSTFPPEFRSLPTT